MGEINNKFWFKLGGAVLALLLFIWMNPWSYNDPTERTIVTTQSGSQKCVFTGGIYWSGLFSNKYF